jgi:membrane protein EpsK
VIVTVTLNAAVGRYMTIALERGNDEEANRYFNTSLFGSVLLVLLLIGPALWATLNVASLIVVPDGQVAQTQWLFAGTVAAFFLATLQSPFGVSTYCMNRFDLQNTISLIQQVARVGIVVLLFSVFVPELWQVGAAALVSMCLGWGWSIRLWRRLTPMLSISISHFSRTALTHLLSMGGWTALNQLGAILFVSIDLVVVNRMLGTEAGGRYAAVLQWSVLLRTVATMIAVVFGPTILYLYARHDIDGLCLYGRQAVKFVGLLLTLPIGYICGFSTPLLRTWLGPDFVELAWLMSLMTAPLAVTLATYPLFGIQTAVNRIRIPGIVTLVMGAANLGLAILFAGPMGWGLYGVAAAGAIVLTGKNLVFTPLYAAHILGRRLDAFLWELLPVAFATLGMAATCKVLSGTWDFSGWPRLIAVGVAVSIAFSAFSYWVLLTREERRLAWSLVPWLNSSNRG